MPTKIMSQTAEFSMKEKSPMAWKKTSGIGRKHANSNHFQLENRESFPRDLKLPEFEFRKRGKQQGCLAFSSWTSMYRQLILRKISPNYVRVVFTQPYRLGADSIGVHRSWMNMEDIGPGVFAFSLGCGPMITMMMSMATRKEHV